ncbi:UNVERIFIED_CONTAM: hypothetical protein GTU68_019918, partial [Idotea baltica]|nr:hypothetical protein [Idotea baltica]
QIQALKEPANYRPTLLLVVLFTLRELGGSLVIFCYAPFFFDTAGTPLDPFSATVLLGFTRLLFTVVASFSVDIFGRRALYVNSSFVCCSMMLLTGLILMYPNPASSWVPLVAMVIFVAFYGLGPGPMPWVLMGEILPTPVRSISASICNFVFCLFFYLQTLFFPQLVVRFGLPPLLLAFGAFNAVTTFVVWLFLPETRGRTLEDLQTAFVGAALRPFKRQREGYLQPYGSSYAEKVKLIPG